jgi:hypothetical protein
MLCDGETCRSNLRWCGLLYEPVADWDPVLMLAAFLGIDLGSCNRLGSDAVRM